MQTCKKIELKGEEIKTQRGKEIKLQRKEKKVQGEGKLRFEEEQFRFKGEGNQSKGRRIPNNKMNYNEQHQHQRDQHIKFEPGAHKYTIDGEEFKSVTTLVGEFFEQFDADANALRIATKQNRGKSHEEILRIAEELKAEWKRKGEAAANLGTRLHADIESFYLGDQQATTDAAYNHFLRFAEEYHLQPYRTEWTIFDEDARVAGTLDMLDCQDGVYTIYDWKRSNKILKKAFDGSVNGEPDELSRWDRHALEPISHIHDTVFQHYALQQSIYRYILEKNYGLEIASCNLVVLHPDYNKHYVVRVPYLKKEVELLLSQR